MHGNKGRKHTKEHNEKIRLSSVGKHFGKHTDEHKKKIGDSCRGEKHWNWIPDRTKLKKQNRRNDPAYFEWRKQVWSRDGFKCKISNENCEGKIECHHILRWSDYPELRYEVNNGITLCHFHHPRKRDEESKLQVSFQELVNSF